MISSKEKILVFAIRPRACGLGAGMGGKNFEKIRREFRILKQPMRNRKLVYLDNASTTQKPNCVIEAEKEFYETTNANIHRAVYELAEKSTEAYELAHAKVAKFIGAESFSEIIFTKNTTEAINLVATALPKKLFAKRKKILVSAMEHHSNLLPWQRLANKTGASLEYVELNEDGSLNMDDFRKKLTRNTAVVAVTHISNVLGVVNPVEEIGKLAHRVGALVLVDAAQSIGRIKIDVKKMGADFLVFSGHKMYGPLGTGVLYGKKEILEKMAPFLLGGDMVSGVTRKKATWNELPWKFEAGTQNIAGGVALGAAIDFIAAIGMEKIWQHDQALVNYILPILESVEGVKIIGPMENVNGERAGVVAFLVDGIHSHDLVTLLDAEGIAARSGHHCAQPLLTTLGIKECARISFGITTTIQELDLFIAALKKSIKILQKNA